MSDPKMKIQFLNIRCVLDALRHPKRGWKISNPRLLWGMIFLLLTIITSGCETPQNPVPAKDFYYLNPEKQLSSIGRVVIVELANESGYPQISTDVTETLFQALQKKQTFGLSIVRRHDPTWRNLRLEDDAALNLNQILTIQETLKCDGLMLGTITEFRPYPHMAVGLRLKLLDLSDGRLLWALEQVWDSTDNAVEKRIKSYYKSKTSMGRAPLHERLASISPLEFAKFISYEVAETL